MFPCGSCQFVKNAPWCLETQISVCACLRALIGLGRSVPHPRSLFTRAVQRDKALSAWVMSLQRSQAYLR